MHFLALTVVLCFASGTLADIVHLKAAKAKLIGHFSANEKHHKRGILSHVPPFKLGHDIPLVTHSIVKPLVVTYPPTAAVASVKVPLANPLVPRYPVGVGHKVAGLPHPHYALRFPHTKYYVKPDHHFHHHHHHVEPKPVVPVLPAPVAPLPPVVHAAPVAPVQPVHHPAPVAHTLPTAVLPAQPVPLTPPPVVFPHSHLRPLLSETSIPLAPAALTRSVFSLPQQYVIRPGAAVQASYFATYPRYPLINSYQAPLFPLHNTATAVSAIPTVPALPAIPAVQSVHQVIQPHTPHFHILPQGIPHESTSEHRPNVVYEQTPTLLQSNHEVPQPTVHVHSTEEVLPHPTFSVQPTQLIPQPTLQPVEHDGWSPVLANPETAHHALHYPQQGHQFVQEQGTQVFEQHDFQHQIQQHIQQQIEQAQYEQNLHNQNHLQQEYGTPQVTHDYSQPNQYQGQDFVQHAHDFAHHAHDVAQHGHDLSQQGYDFSQQGHDLLQGHDFLQHGQDFEQHPSPEYGVPQPEGRSSDDDTQQYHNHIPLTLQPPIDRPLDHFQ